MLETDEIFPSFRGEFNDGKVFFTPIASLYPIDRVQFNYHGFYVEHYAHEPIFQNANINEALIGKALLESYGMLSMHLKSREGRNLIEHIGKYTIGQKLLPHEPGFDAWKHLDPTIKYVSGTCNPYVG
jgi:hypothetical protein